MAEQKPFIPSPYQEAIFDWTTHGQGSAGINACAGSGKTTTIVKALEHIPTTASALFLAFNKRIADELQRRMPPNAKGRTFHSLGFQALRSRLGEGMMVEVHKNRLICREKLSRREYLEFQPFICKLTSIAKGTGIGVLVPDDEQVWLDLVEHQGLYLDNSEDIEYAISLAHDLMAYSEQQAESRRIIDFDDQLYLPVLWNLPMQKYPWLFVDEAQDTNPIRRHILEKSLDADGRLVAVGDPHQAIYGFTGASVDSMEQIKKTFNCIDLPLTISYRCPKAIVALAQKIVPSMEVFDGAIEGTILRPEGEEEKAAILLGLDPRQVILCRTTQPLVAMAYWLIHRGKGAKILGRDIGENLINLVRRMKATGVADLGQRLAVYLHHQVELLLARDKEEQAASLRDRVECILVILENLTAGEVTVEDVIAHINSLFNEQEGVLTLSTVHKAKGLEWDTVVILRPELMPSPWAKQEWQQDQERNLIYVALTRSKNTLIFI